MSKESKILLFVIVLCTLFLAGLMYFLEAVTIGTNLRAVRALGQEVKATAVPTVEPTATASVSAAPKGKASPSVKATVKATATPEATAEATPEQ
jgi:hypothetical protein